MNAWLKRCVFNLDLNRESVTEPRTLSGRLFQSSGVKYEKVLPPLWRFSTAWYGTVRHGSVRYGTAQFGSVCISTAV